MNWILLLAIAVLAAVATDSRADTPGLRPELVDTPYLAARGIAMHFPVIGALRIMDKRGEHLLVLTRNADLSPSRPKSPPHRTHRPCRILLRPPRRWLDDHMDDTRQRRLPWPRRSGRLLHGSGFLHGSERRREGRGHGAVPLVLRRRYRAIDRQGDPARRRHEAGDSWRVDRTFAWRGAVWRGTPV